MASIENKINHNLSLAIRNSAFGFASLACRLVGSSLIFIVIARLPGIGVIEFGQITYAIALSGLFIIFSEFGFNPLIIREIAAEPKRLKLYARSVLSLRLILSFIGFLLFFAFLKYVNIENQGHLICVVIGIAFYLGSFSGYLQAILQSQEKMHLELLCIVVENVSMVIIILFTFFFKPNAIKIAFVFLITKTISLIINYIVCGRFVLWVYPIFNTQIWRKLFLEALPFALAGVITTGIVQIDTVLLRELSMDNPELNVGLYQAAMRLFLVPMLLPQIVLKVFLPQLSRMHGNKGTGLLRNLCQVNNILFTLGLLIGLVTYFRGNDLVYFFYGEKLADAGPLLKVLGITIMMRFGAAYNLYFTIRNRIWFRVWTGIVGLFAVILFNFLLIPKFGVMGVAYASVASHIVYWLPWLIAIYKYEKTIWLGWRILPALISFIILISFLYATSHFSLFYMLPVYSLVVCLLTFFTIPSVERSKIISQYTIRGACSNVK